MLTLYLDTLLMWQLKIAKDQQVKKLEKGRWDPQVYVQLQWMNEVLRQLSSDMIEIHTHDFDCDIDCVNHDPTNIDWNIPTRPNALPQHDFQSSQYQLPVLLPDRPPPECISPSISTLTGTPEETGQDAGHDQWHFWTSWTRLVERKREKHWPKH